MSQLAGSDVTRQTIFLIEAGKSRPSIRTLEIIASRTGKAVRSFLKAPGKNPRDGSVRADARVEELQALCLQNQFDTASAVGSPRHEQPMAPNDRANARHYTGQALVRSIQPDRAS